MNTEFFTNKEHEILALAAFNALKSVDNEENVEEIQEKIYLLSKFVTYLGYEKYSEILSKDDYLHHIFCRLAPYLNIN